ncbi:hypothetical protein WICPIJ_000536 [Wickerhamomyces pijperi]|uniref:Uncharacterized protein n=1 Tax=Wickerhamomyces pijperi TaxID=599730 RepID=A0A9P8TQR4_WICPI|nr:hypothetical protein WICPIJ_000536 [Wickerhamomyces pijperi]
MEKYSQFRDKATGIAPFWPNSQTSSSFLSSTNEPTALTAIIEFILKHVTLVIKSVVLLPLCLLSLLFTGSLGFTNPITQSLNGLLLVAIGLTSTEYTVENIKTRNINKKVHFPVKGDLLFVNFSTPLDLFVLSTLCNDPFVCLIPTSKGHFKKVSVLEFFHLGLSEGSTTEFGSDFTTAELKGKIIFIFAEGTTSNGKSILPFSLSQAQFTQFYNELTQSNIKISKINTVGMKLTPSYFTTPLHVSSFQYVYRLLTCLTTMNFKIRLNTVNELKPLELDLPKIRKSFTNSGKFKLVSLGISEKKEFVKKLASNGKKL